MVTKFQIDKSISWWVITPQKRKNTATSRFSKDFVDFIEHTSLPCYSKMVDPSYGFLEKYNFDLNTVFLGVMCFNSNRVIWFSVHVCTISLLIVFLSDAWNEFVQQYFATTLYDPLYPIEKVPFPAISICSNNRISRQAAEKYAIELSQVDPERRNETFFMEHIAYLGLLFNKDFTLSELPDVYEFQQFLDIYDTGDDEKYYNTLRKIAQLTPPCEELLHKCFLGGKPVKCFSNRTFKTTLTSYGYCCTFNSNDIYHTRKQEQRFSHSDLGLTVVLNTSSKDIHYPLLRIDGTVVMVHSAHKYPDISSGGSSENFITNGEDNFLAITPYIIDSVEAVRQFSPKTRNCYFHDESPDNYLLGRLQYSFNNCVTRCRIKSILVLCSCLPFNMPFEMTPNGTRTVYCTLRHLECLRRYRFKWKSVLTYKIFIPGLEREAEDALYCPQCLPSCDDIQYKTFLTSSPLDYAAITDLPFKPEDENDVTVVRVYFAEQYIKFYRKIVTNSWFEAFSTIGNYCGIIIGFSLITFCEVAFFFGEQIMLVMKRGLQKGKGNLIIYP